MASLKFTSRLYASTEEEKNHVEIILTEIPVWFTIKENDHLSIIIFLFTVISFFFKKKNKNMMWRLLELNLENSL